MVTTWPVKYASNLPASGLGYTEIIYEDVEGFLGDDTRVVGDLPFEVFVIERGV